MFTGPADNPTAAICARIESDKRAGEAGWVHRLRDDHTTPTRKRRRVVSVASKAVESKPPIDFSAMARDAELAATPVALERFAESLGLSLGSLTRLRVGWSVQHRAWTFPMSDAAGETVGIRLRLPDGRKLSVRGGREGLFIPKDLQAGGRLLVTEGPTDCAALLALGFSAIGRPSCTGGVKHLVALAQRLQPGGIAIVADGDEPGQRGAKSLAARLAVYCAAVRIVTPPDGIKDARAWKQSGATAADVQAAIDAAPVRRLPVT
ncbi:MAG TPA: toprim domain-containing protein, partial [Thermoguttaceae bacterium]|nr:toprim domain-containing protein [Thermoguttaceae bacterium]